LPAFITRTPSGALWSGIAELSTSAILRVVEDLRLAAREPGLRILLLERRDEVGLLRVQRDELAAAAQQRVRLAVDVRVVDPDDGEAHGRLARRLRGRLGVGRERARAEGGDRGGGGRNGPEETAAIEVFASQGACLLRPGPPAPASVPKLADCTRKRAPRGHSVDDRLCPISSR
jgi:hypothetical protein